LESANPSLTVWSYNEMASGTVTQDKVTQVYLGQTSLKRVISVKRPSFITYE